ncbi:MAG: hypothetical protein M3Y71_14300 [Actinomycetota bacterium]|nr:hypothetical protein [Actinomycetota bacterium]
MNDDETTLPARSRWLTAAESVGDLGSPFYDDERQRDVWNEASAVGFQTMLWLTAAAAAAMVWIGGETALPYALVVFAIAGVGAVTAVGYARAYRVDVGTHDRLPLRRLLPYLALVAVFTAGVLRTTTGDGIGGGLGTGVGIGVAVGSLAAVGGTLYGRRTRPGLD